MNYARVPFIDKPVSRIVLGGSGKRFASGADISEVMDAALESGINCVDTARAYGDSEAAIGRYFRAHGRREDFVLISKCCHPAMAFLSRVNREAAESDLMRSLDTLGTDHIDLFFLHRDDESVSVEPIAEFMNHFREKGLIKAFGGSNWSARRIEALNSYAAGHGLMGFSASSPHYSLGQQHHDPWGNGCKTITGDNNADQRDYYNRTQMPLFCWASLCGGVFSGAIPGGDPGLILKRLGINAAWGYGSRDNMERLRRCEILAEEKGVSVARIALAWLLGSELNTLAIVTCNTAQRVRENARAAEIALNQEERRWLETGK